MEEIKSDSKRSEKKEKHVKPIQTEKKEKPEFNPDPKKCEFYILNKNRYCHFDKIGDTQNCPHHQESQDKFVKCPLDPQHSVAKSKLKKHLEVCNKTQDQ